MGGTARLLLCPARMTFELGHFVCSARVSSSFVVFVGKMIIFNQFIRSASLTNSKNIKVVSSVWLSVLEILSSLRAWQNLRSNTYSIIRHFGFLQLLQLISHWRDASFWGSLNHSCRLTYWPDPDLILKLQLGILSFQDHPLPLQDPPSK